MPFPHAGQKRLASAASFPQLLHWTMTDSVRRVDRGEVERWGFTAAAMYIPAERRSTAQR